MSVFRFLDYRIQKVADTAEHLYQRSKKLLAKAQLDLPSYVIKRREEYHFAFLPETQEVLVLRDAQPFATFPLATLSFDFVSPAAQDLWDGLKLQQQEDIISLAKKTAGYKEG